MVVSNTWAKLIKDYKKRGLVLALGAGVSKGCNLPNWEELLRRLAKESKLKGAASVFDELRTNGFTLPAIASMLESDYKDDFSRAIKEALYQDFPFRNGIDGNNQQDFIDFVRKNNSTLASIAALCICKTDGSYEPNPRVHAIVNFNYDSTFRAYVNVRYDKSDILRSIERPSATSIFGTIPVYYMHGFIRFDKDLGDLRHGAPDRRVLTEQEYFNFYNDPNGLFNYTFLYLLREHPCLFLGASMIDDNIRRLLHYSKKEREMGYIQEGRADEAEEKSIRHYAVLKSPPSQEIAGLTEISLKRLGVNVLWLNDFAEMPDLLAKVYESASGTWGDVN
jgi:hypothetical protein